MERTFKVSRRKNRQSQPYDKWGKGVPERGFLHTDTQSRLPDVLIRAYKVDQINSNE